MSNVELCSVDNLVCGGVLEGKGGHGALVTVFRWERKKNPSLCFFNFPFFLFLF